MICALILAAGKSQRMGAQKVLLPFGERTVIAHIAREVLRGPVTRALVVAGADRAEIAKALAGEPTTVVANPDPQGDMLSSVRCGLRALPADCEAVLVALGDQPAVTSDLVRRIVCAFRSSGGGIVVPVHEGKRGHPLLFPTRYRQEILTEYDGVGLRGLLRAHPQDVLELPGEGPSVLSDMDFPQDYRRELDKHRTRDSRLS